MTPQETLYPVHLAAHLGDADLLRLVLQAGADATQQSSMGRSAWDVAVQSNVYGSHDEAHQNNPKYTMNHGHFSKLWKDWYTCLVLFSTLVSCSSFTALQLQCHGYNAISALPGHLVWSFGGMKETWRCP